MPLTVRDCVIKLHNNRLLCTTFPFVTPGCVSHFCTLHRFSPFHCAVFVFFRVPLRKLELPNARGKVECQERLTGGRFFHPGARLSRDVRYRGQQSAVTLQIDHTKKLSSGTLSEARRVCFVYDSHIGHTKTACRHVRSIPMCEGNAF